MRRRYSGDQPNDARWSIANAGDTGEVLEAAIRLGAKTDLMDEAWWLPSIFIADGGDAARALGQRSAAARRHLRRRHRQAVLQRIELLRRGRQGDVRQQGGAVLDGLRRGLHPSIRLGSEPVQETQPPRRTDRAGRGPARKHHRRSRAPDGGPADTLEQTVKRFNGFAAKGLDPDFGRGQSAYNDCLGDPGYRPNAAVGPLDRAPYYATRVVPADVGTCGGLITNEYAQVLDENDRVIEGLYATGNITATVMGRNYLGRRRKHRLHDGLRLCRRPARRRIPANEPLAGRKIPLNQPRACARTFTSSSPSMNSRGFMPDCLSSARRA